MLIRVYPHRCARAYPSSRVSTGFSFQRHHLGSVRRMFASCVAIVLLYVGALAAGDELLPPTGRPTPLEKLNSLVGRSEMKVTNRFTPNAKPFIGRVFDNTRWSENKQFLISDQWVLLPSGWLPKLIITSWDAISGQYRQTNVLPNATYVNILSFGEEQHIRYTESEKDGHITGTWTTIETISPSVSKIRAESSIDGGPRWVSAEGTITKRAP